MTTEKEWDPWELGSGLPLEDVDATVQAIVATYDNEYNPGALVIKITWLPDTPGAEPKPQLYSVGKGWETNRDGDVISHESGQNRRINDQSNYGRLIKAAVECDGAREYFNSIPGAEPRQLSMWLDTKWHLGSVEYAIPGSDKDPKTGEPKRGSVPVPTAFLGGKATNKGAAKGKGKATTTTAADPSTNGFDPKLRAKLTVLAKQSADYSAFLESAFELDDVTASVEAQNAVMDTADGSIWAMAHPEG